MYMNKAARFGFPTGKAESGTEGEFNWAIGGHRLTGFPEIKRYKIQALLISKPRFSDTPSW